MPRPDPTRTARPRWRGIAALGAAALLVGACSGGGGSSREDVIDTLTDEDLDDPLSTEEAACAYDRLRAEFGDDLGDVTGGRVLDDDDEVVTRVSQIVQACASGSGPQPTTDDADTDDADTDDADADSTTGDED